jgi:hypothetical protein
MDRDLVGLTSYIHHGATTESVVKANVIRAGNNTLGKDKICRDALDSPKLTAFHYCLDSINSRMESLGESSEHYAVAKEQGRANL